MESSGQGKSKVSNPSVKKEILYQCENKIRLMYKKRLSGLGAFIPEPVEEVMVNNNSSPLIVHHRYLLYNQGLEKDIWNCPGIIKPPVKKINSPKFLADSSEQPALIETLDSSKHRVKPKVSTTYSQFNKNVQVVESNITVSTMPYEQFNKNVQVVRSNETVSNISHEQLLPSTYPVLQHNSPAWLGSYNQPTWQEIPAAHQHNYLLSYPLHPSQAKSQNFPEEIRNLTYPINATNLLCPFYNNMYNTKKSTQSNITSVMGIESLEHSYQSNTVKGKMPDERKSKSPSLRRRHRSRIPLFPRRKSKSPLSPRRKSKSTLSRRRWSKSPLSPRRRSKSPLSSRRTRSPLSLSENEEDNFSPPVIDFAHFCHLVGPEIRKLQVMSLFYEGIIVALEKGDQSCGRSYKLQDGALCKKFTKLRIIIPHDYLIDCILILHQNFHTSTQKEICEFIKYYMYPAVHHIRKNVGRAFSECPQCKETRRSTKCALINEGNAEKTNESKQTMKVIKLEKEIDSMIGEQILTDSVNMNNNDKTCQNEIEEAEDSSLGRYPHEYGKETKIESEISEHDNECWNNDKLNVSKDNTLLSATIELSSSTSKDEVKIIDDRSQKCIILKGENSEVEVVEKSSKAQEMLAPNKPKGGSDFKARVRAVQLKCKESKERLVALEAGESSETYLLKGGMLCEKVRTADTVDIKIVAPLSEVDSIIGIVHTMSKTHTPESQGKSKVSDPSVKKKILYQCENKIRLMYKKRLSGLGAFIPEPVEEVMINNSSSPLIVHHPYLSYNQGSEKVIWKCLGIKIPSVKKISSTKYVENLQKNPSLNDSWGLPERSFLPHVSASYPQFDKNVQVGGINETVSNMPYEQLNKNLQVAGSNVHFPSIPHKQLLPSTYPVLQHNSPACLGSYNQPTWQEIPATHQHNYMLSYPLHPSQPKSQYFPEVIRDLTYPISATNLFHPFDDTKGSTQSSISPLMSIDCLNPSQQSDIVFEGKIPGERNVINSNLQRNSKSLSSKRRPRSRIPLSPRRRSKSPLSPGRRSKSPLSPTRRTISPLSRRRRSKSPLSSRRRSKSLLSSRRTRSPLSSGRPRSPSSRRSRSPLSSRKNKRSSPIGRIRRENHSPLEVEDTGKSDPNVVNRKAQRKAKQLSYKNLVPIVADNNFHNAPQTQAGDSVVQSKNIVEVIMGTSNMQSNAEDRKEKSELSGQKRNYESFISDKTTESNVQDKVISESNDNLYEVVSQNSGNLVVYVPTSTCKSEDDIKNLSTMKSIADFEFQGISFMDFCRRVGTEIGKLQEKSSTCSGIIASLKEGAKTYKRAYILKDGVLCKKFPLLRIMIPEEYLVDSILVLHQQFHFATQEDICQVIDNYTYPGLNFEKANVKRAFDECTQCIESKKCRLTDDKNSEETIQSKRTTKEVVNLDKQTVYVIGEQNIADSGCVKNIDNADQLSVNTFHNETEETVDSSLGGKPYEYEKETEKKSETLEHNNKCCVNENPNESSNDNLISTTTESSSSTLKNRDETAQDLNQNTSATTRENNDVGIVEKSSEIRDQSDSNQPKGGLDFKTQVRAVQLKCKQLNERLVSLKAGESSDEKYLLKGGMLCEKVQTADTVEIKIVAPLSEVDSIISIVHTMPKTHTPENILIAFFLKHFTYIPELNEKVKKIVGACSICST